MTTNNKPWQAIVTNENLSKSATTENSLTVVDKKSGASYQSNAYALKVINPKRYSIDDNGGGYKGL